MQVMGFSMSVSYLSRSGRCDAGGVALDLDHLHRPSVVVDVALGLGRGIRRPQSAALEPHETFG